MKGRALRSAFYRGMMAGLAGDEAQSCPYEDKRKADGRLTWSRAYRNAWRDGWLHATNDRDQALITAKYWKN